MDKELEKYAKTLGVIQEKQVEKPTVFDRRYER